MCIIKTHFTITCSIVCYRIHARTLIQWFIFVIYFIIYFIWLRSHSRMCVCVWDPCSSVPFILYFMGIWISFENDSLFTRFLSLSLAHSVSNRNHFNILLLLFLFLHSIAILPPSLPSSHLGCLHHHRFICCHRECELGRNCVNCKIKISLANDRERESNNKKSLSIGWTYLNFDFAMVLYIFFLWCGPNFTIKSNNNSIETEWKEMKKKKSANETKNH